MNSPTRFSILAAGLVAASTTWAAGQNNLPQDPQIQFVSSGPRPVELPRSVAQSDLVTSLVTLRTLPSIAGGFPNMNFMGILGPQGFERLITNEALGAVFGWHTPHRSETRRIQPSGVRGVEYSRRPKVVGRGWIGRQPDKEGDEDEGSDHWMIVAVDEPTAKALTEAFLKTFREHAGRAVRESRKQHEKAVAELQKNRDLLAEYQADLREAEDTCRTAGVLNMSLPAIEEAIGKIRHEQRINDIDIAGITARLAALKERLDTTNPELKRALTRLQVESEIELAGKLGRQAPLAKEMRQLDLSHKARTALDKLPDSISSRQRKIKGSEGYMPTRRERLQHLENLAAFEILSNRAVISGILSK